MSDFTTERDLGRYTGSQNPASTLTGNTDKLEKNYIFCSEFGSNITAFYAVCVSEVNDKWYHPDVTGITRIQSLGIAEEAFTSGEDGHIVGPGGIAVNGSWDWDLSKPIFLANAPSGSLSQTPGTYAIIMGFPKSPTRMIVCPIILNFQLSHIADPTAAAALTFITHAWDGSTYPSAAEGNELVADLAALKTGIDNNKAAIDSILARLEKILISASS